MLAAQIKENVVNLASGKRHFLGFFRGVRGKCDESVTRRELRVTYESLALAFAFLKNAGKKQKEIRLSRRRI